MTRHHRKDSGTHPPRRTLPVGMIVLVLSAAGLAGVFLLHGMIWDSPRAALEDPAAVPGKPAGRTGVTAGPAGAPEAPPTVARTGDPGASTVDPAAGSPETGRPGIAGPGVEPVSSEEPMEERIAEYEQMALRYPDVLRVHVATEAPGDPGFVAFTPRPYGMGAGLAAGMEDLARLYLEVFTEAPSIKVAVVIGGGVRREFLLTREDTDA